MTANQASSVRTACSSCGERLGADDNFCVGCGLRVAEMTGGGSQTPSPTDATIVANTPIALPSRAELRLTALPTAGSAIVATCSHCQTTLGPEERFCAGCGRPRDGTEVLSVTGLESKAEAGWREVQERLQAATAGRYQVIRELGRGGMAAVYLAREVALNREVAIKVMRPSFLLDPGMVERFLREARTMASLRHPNIVAIHSVEEANQLYFFVMQYIPGCSLDRVIRGEPLPVAVMQALIYEAAAALTHAHGQRVVHRDIKPANIMLDRDGSAIVTDFGIAKVADVQATSATVGQMGTPLYMSPEQCEGLPVTPFSDQYSLGNVAYEMLTGVPPFQRPTAIALGTAILHEKPKPVRAFRNDCPVEIDNAVLKMLAKAPQDRFPTLAEAAAALGGDRLGDDDPLREYLRLLAKGDGRTDGKHLTPRPSKAGPWSRRQWTSLVGGRLRRAVSLVILLGMAVPLGYYVIRKWQGGGASAPSRPAPSDPASPSSGATVLPAPIPPPLPPIAESSNPPGTPPNARAARVSNLMRTVRTSIRRNDWRTAADSLAIAMQLGPRTAELQALDAQVRVGLARVLAENGGSAKPTQPAAPGPPPVAGPVPATNSGPPKRLFDDAPARQAIDGYVAAINGRSLERIRAAYPGLTPAQATEWRDRFDDREIQKLTATASRARVEETADGARATFVLDLTLVPKGAAPLTYRIRCDAVLGVEGNGWKIRSLSEQGTEG